MGPPPMNAERFKRADAASYDPLAGEFDQFESIRAPLLETLFSQIDLTGARRILDAGAGTGIAAIEAARRTGAQVWGIDLSDGLLRRARQKSASARFLKMDAEALAFKSDSFDAALSVYALLHFPNPERALAEMFRVLRPGGAAVIAVGSAPPWSRQGLLHRVSRAPDVWRLARGRLLLAPGFLDDLLNRMFPQGAGAEETGLARRSKIRAGDVLSMMGQAGFTALGSHWEGYRETFADAEQFWLLQRTYSSIARKRLGALPEGDRQAVKRAFLGRCACVQSQGGLLIYPHAAFFARGRKP